MPKIRRSTVSNINQSSLTWQNSSIARSTFVDVVEPERTVLDDGTKVDSLFGISSAIWKETPMYELWEFRQKSMMKWNAYNNAMAFLDNFLIVAKKELAREEITALPKTPAPKKKKTKPNPQEKKTASVAPSDATEKPTRQKEQNKKPITAVKKKVEEFEKLISSSPRDVKSAKGSKAVYKQSAKLEESLFQSPSPRVPESQSTPQTILRKKAGVLVQQTPKPMSSETVPVAMDTNPAPSDEPDAVKACQIFLSDIKQPSVLTPSREPVIDIDHDLDVSLDKSVNVQRHEDCALEQSQRKKQSESKCSEKTEAEADPSPAAEVEVSATRTGQFVQEQQQLITRSASIEQIEPQTKRSTRTKSGPSPASLKATEKAAETQSVSEKLEETPPSQGVVQKTLASDDMPKSHTESFKPPEVITAATTVTTQEDKAQPGRMTRSKMRQPPQLPTQSATTEPSASTISPEPGTSTQKTPSKTPARNHSSPAIITNQGASTSVVRKAQPEAAGPMSRQRSSSDSSNLLVRTLTKAASHGRITGMSSLALSKQSHTMSTPDMTRTSSFVKALTKPGRISPQTTPSFARTLTSFIKRTPQKTFTKDELLEMQKQKIREKQELETIRMQEAEREKARQLEAKKQERNEKMKKVQEQRQAKLKEMKEKELEKKRKDTEKEKRDADERRRKEEESRLQKLKENEKMKKMNEQISAEADKQKLIQKAKELALKKITEQSMLSGKTIPAQYRTEASEKKPSIYDQISAKNQALAQDRAAIINHPAVKKTDSTLSAKTAHNSTYTMDEEDDDFFDVDKLEEEDEFEDSKFRNCVNARWCKNKNEFNAAVITQFERLASGELDVADILGEFSRHTPDLPSIFSVHKPRFFKRTSSAMWASPPLKWKKV